MRSMRAGRTAKAPDSISFSEGDQLLVVDHVPAEVCPHCGEVSLQPDVVDRLQETVWRHRAPVRLIETPVYQFTP